MLMTANVLLIVTDLLQQDMKYNNGFVAMTF